jgi:cyclopropane-fatty-acyl-phospholipid synthase
MMLERLCLRAFLHSLESIRAGCLNLVYEGERYRFGDPASDLRAEVHVHDSRFFRQALLHGDIGIGESYMDGHWTSPDVTAVIRLAVRNLHAVESGNAWLSALNRATDAFRHARRANTIAGSRRNIRDHYDLNNDFFQLFLDQRMVYSCAWYESAEDTLEAAQLAKLDRACRKLQLSASDHLLEIGTGWGAMAIHHQPGAIRLRERADRESWSGKPGRAAARRLSQSAGRLRQTGQH